MSTFELMITVTIISVISLIVFQFMNAGNQSTADNELRIQLKEQADRILTRIFDDLKKAGKPTVNILEDLATTGSLSGFWIPTDCLTGAGTDVIGFQIPEVDAQTGTILKSDMTINYGDKTIYCLDTNRRIKRVQVTSANVIGGTEESLGQNVTDFQVLGDQNVAPNNVEITLSLQGTSLSKRVILQGEGSALTLTNYPTYRDDGSLVPGGGVSTPYGDCPTPPCGF